MNNEYFDRIDREAEKVKKILQFFIKASFNISISNMGNEIEKVANEIVAELMVQRKI